MSISTILTIAVFLFIASETALAFFKRSRIQTAKSVDRASQIILWTSIAVGVYLAMVCRQITFGRLNISYEGAAGIALTLLAAGLAVRWTAILTLGRFFTSNIAIQTGHRLVDTGIYKFVRHPSYSGLLLAFLGIGCAHANWISVASLMIPVTAALLYRIAKEEQVLRAALGGAYDDYCRRTKRLVPLVF
jgi:protein-S-isoprenylcysteine O-methyltransferase Ste14